MAQQHLKTFVMAGATVDHKSEAIRQFVAIAKQVQWEERRFIDGYYAILKKTLKRLLKTDEFKACLVASLGLVDHASVDIFFQLGDVCTDLDDPYYDNKVYSYRGMRVELGSSPRTLRVFVPSTENQRFTPIDDENLHDFFDAIVSKIHSLRFYLTLENSACATKMRELFDDLMRGYWDFPKWTQLGPFVENISHDGMAAGCFPPYMRTYTIELETAYHERAAKLDGYKLKIDGRLHFSVTGNKAHIQLDPPTAKSFVYDNHAREVKLFIDKNDELIVHIPAVWRGNRFLHETWTSVPSGRSIGRGVFGVKQDDARYNGLVKEFLRASRACDVSHLPGDPVYFYQYVDKDVLDQLYRENTGAQ
jgi:hypothetical protein